MSEPYDAPAKVKRDWLVPATGVFLIVAVVCGGSSSSPISAGIVRVAAAPVLALGLMRLRRDDWARGALWPLVLIAAAAAYLVIQLIPLPPALWTALPERSLYARTYATAGLPTPWLPIDLAPWSGWGALLGLLPPAAMLAALPTISNGDRRLLTYGVLGLALASTALGMAQMAGGQTSPLRFYAITNPEAAVGFFANRNHEASFLVSTLPLAGYLAVRGLGREGGNLFFWMGLAGAYVLVIALGAATSGSRAGMVLAVLGAVGALVVAARAAAKRPGPEWRIAALGWPALLVVLVAGLTALTIDPSLATSLESHLGGDLRFSLTPLTVQAGLKFAPLGSGAGSFVDVFQMIQPIADMGPAYINHAHDDLAELWLETGVPGILIMAGVAIWWVKASLEAMSERRRHGAALSLAGSMMVGILLVHSLVDYPLRTPALATLTAFALGLITRPRTTNPSPAS